MPGVFNFDAASGIWCQQHLMKPHKKYRAEFSDAHSTKAVALAFACRCNFRIDKVKSHCNLVSMPQAAFGRCNFLWRFWVLFPSDVSMPQAAVGRCNIYIKIFCTIQYCFNAASSIRSLQLYPLWTTMDTGPKRNFWSETSKSTPNRLNRTWTLFLKRPTSRQ